MIRPGFLRPGDAAELNRALAVLSYLGRVGPASEDLYVTQANGWTSLCQRPVGLWAKITGAPVGGAHPWQQQRETTPGTFAELVGGLTGTTTRAPAYVPGGGTVATGTVVWLDLAAARDHYLIAGAGPPGPPGGTITVREADNVPTVTSVSTVTCGQATGLRVQAGGAGEARLDLLEAGLTQAGAVGTGVQHFAGAKTFHESLAFANPGLPFGDAGARRLAWGISAEDTATGPISIVGDVGTPNQLLLRVVNAAGTTYLSIAQSVTEVLIVDVGLRVSRNATETVVELFDGRAGKPVPKIHLTDPSGTYAGETTTFNYRRGDNTTGTLVFRSGLLTGHT